MTLQEYQTLSRATAFYPDAGKNYTYPSLGIAGEVGELLNKIKKISRDEGGVVTEERKQEIALEMGDVLWYLAQIGTEFGLSLEDVAKKNLEHLLSRKARGVLSGSGDNR